MDKESDVVFNNQNFEHAGGHATSLGRESSGSFAPLIYNQGRHHELLEAVAAADYQATANILNSTTNHAALLNLTDPTFKQTVLYKVVTLPNPSSALEFARLCITKGALIIIKDVHGQSPLFYVCKEGRTDLLYLFLENKADINETDNFRQTPLFYAARDGKYEMVRTMIENKVNVNHKDMAEQTALFYAARDNRLPTVKLLVENGAEVNVADNKKQTALFFVKKNGHREIEDYLISQGAVNTKDGTLKQSDIRKNIKQVHSELTSPQDQERRQHLRKQRCQGAQVDRRLQKEIQTDGPLRAQDRL